MIHQGEDNDASGAYPIVKRFFSVTKPTRAAAEQQFIAFVASPSGRDMLAQAGHRLP